jgi:hypothetical protein
MSVTLALTRFQSVRSPAGSMPEHAHSPTLW